MNDLLVSLLRFLLFGGANPLEGQPMPTEAEWQQLFDNAKSEAVTALVCDALALLPQAQRPPRRILFHFATVAQTIETDNRRREAALISFADRVQAALGLSTVVVKGSALASRYPVPLHRECGDNDLYTGADTERICTFFEAHGISIDRHNPRHAVLGYEATTFELHHHLLYSGSDPQWSPVPFGDSQALMRLPAVQEAFFLAKQLEYQSVFFHEPVSLRGLLDWTLLVGEPEFDPDAFQAFKQGTDIDRFADLLSAYCAQLFNATLPYDGERLQALDLKPEHFEALYRALPPRHPRALVRVVRRSWHYLRHRRRYRALYGQSMFRRFYWRNLRQALRQRL
ncbi:MAG: nucleotidyltransferase family protein [Bacteroidales bacterium]|nr:nucleotidyltransferase family protein [Bacteroidales bacterium]